MADLERLLAERLAPAFVAVAGRPADPTVRRSDHADFQVDGAFAVARTVGRSPREVAAAVLDQVSLDDLCSSVEVAGGGFINLTVSDELLGRLLGEMRRDDRLGVPAVGAPETVVVDYSAPNAAKEMHVGHLRSTIIGDAAVRLLEWLGHSVLRENHVGDWGTPFGMLIEHLSDIGEAEAAHELSVGDLDGFYRAARQKFDADEDFRRRSRQRVVMLQSGDPDTRRLWELLVSESEKYFLAVYRRLGVRLTQADFVGESSYDGQLSEVVSELDRLGLLEESDGAKCVFPIGFTNRSGEPLPLIVQKNDGGYGYAATDLATIRDRILRLGATRLLYVIGLPQRLHLEMVFEVAREAGWLAPPARAEHVGHGSVLGEDGRPLRTRAGASVKLMDLLDEAVARAGALIVEKDPDLDQGARAALADAVGIGAVKYADLSSDRVRDYVFSYDRMLAFDGNTAPYLQYAHARIRSIFRRAGQDVPNEAGPILVAERAEHALAIELLSFESVGFHRLTGHLYRLATTFTTFYERWPVLRAEGPLVRESRLGLCDLTARVLARGLDLLGIQAPERM